MASRKKTVSPRPETVLSSMPDVGEWMKAWTLPLQQNPFASGFSMPGMPPMPSSGPGDWMKALSPDELRKRRQELEAVSGWLTLQQTTLKSTVQLLDMQIAAFEALQPKA